MARKIEFDIPEKLDKAKSTFWEKGYQATSMQDLIQVMELNPGSIYGTFGDKHQLFLESLKMYCQQVMTEVKEASKKSDCPMACVKAVIQKSVQRTFSENGPCMVIKTTFELSTTDAEAQKILRAQIDELIDLLEPLLKLAQKSGQISGDKDPRILAMFIVSSFSSLAYMHMLNFDKKSIISISEHIIESL